MWWNFIVVVLKKNNFLFAIDVFVCMNLNFLLEITNNREVEWNKWNKMINDNAGSMILESIPEYGQILNDLSELIIFFVEVFVKNRLKIFYL